MAALASAGFCAGPLLGFTTFALLGLTVGGDFGCTASDASGFLLSDVFGFFDGFVVLAVLFWAVGCLSGSAGLVSSDSGCCADMA